MGTLTHESSGGCGAFTFGITWTAFSSIFLIIGVSLVISEIGKSSWEEVPCQITAFEISVNKGADQPFTPQVKYTYQWEGRSYQGTNLWQNDGAEDDYEELGRLQYEYRQGLIKTCFVNPGAPSESYLKSDGSQIMGGLMFAIMGGGFVAIGIGLILSARSGKKRSERPARALSSKSEEGNFPKAIAVPFFTIFAAAGLLVLFGVVIPDWVRYFDAKHWQETPAEVIWSRVKSHSGDDGTTYSADIFYRYQFGDTHYRSNSVRLFSGSSSGRRGYQHIVDAHPPEKKITCFVDPENPWRALLKREMGWWALFTLFPLPFLAVGFGGLWFVVFKPGSAKKKGAPPHKVESSASRSERDPVASRQLKPGIRRVGGMLGILLVALFWNGIVWLFLSDVIDSFFRGNPSWFLTIFLIPFVVIGLGLAFMVLYTFLTLFNPRTSLTLEPGDLTLGENATLRWVTAGGASRMSRFAIYLVGEEEAEYKRGTSTATDTSVFYERALVETEDSRQTAHGSAPAGLPTATMPSWNGGNNRIKWTLRVRGKIRFWPDVSDDYEITVLAPDEG